MLVVVSVCSGKETLKTLNIIYFFISLLHVSMPKVIEKSADMLFFLFFVFKKLELTSCFFPGDSSLSKILENGHNC